MIKLDHVDKKILRLLQENARTTISALSSAVSLSMPAVSERVKRLESSGIIQNMTAILNPALVDKQLTALIQIGFDRQNNADQFINYVEEENDIRECFHTTGTYEYLLKVQTQSADTLAALLNRVKAQVGVNKTHSIVVLSTVFDRPSVTIE